MLEKSLSTEIQYPAYCTLIENHELAVAVSPRFGAIYNVWNSQGKPLLWQPGYPKNAISPIGGCFPLVPFANRIKNASFTIDNTVYQLADNKSQQPHALHGDGWTSTWQIMDKGDSWVKLVHLGNFYPYHYLAELTIVLRQNVLSQCLEIIHFGKEPLPYGVGFHPWFRKNDHTQLFAPATHMWHEDEHHFPTSKVSVPNQLDFSSLSKTLPHDFINALFQGWQVNQDGQYRATIFQPEEKLTISIQANQTLDRYMLYQDGSDFFCFEPVSHNVNAHNEEGLPGLKVLEQYQNIQAKMDMSFIYEE